MSAERAERPVSEVEITPEMAEAGARVLAERFDQVNDWLTRDIATEVFLAMLASVEA